MKLITSLKNRAELVVSAFRQRYQKKKQKRLRNTDFSLIASNCNGGIILHDLNLKFNTPFINLSLPPKDFIKLAGDFEHYMALELKELPDETVSYPVGQLGDLRINFVHYPSFEEAKRKWDERKQRINYNNLFFMLTEREGCTLDDLQTFDRLPMKRKVAFTHKKYPSVKCAFYLRGFENSNGVGLSMHHPHFFSIKRYVDQFDFVTWVNETESP